MTPKEKAIELVEIEFDFNGYVLNESNKETSKKMALRTIWLIIGEIDNIYQVNYWKEVEKEIEKL